MAPSARDEVFAFFADAYNLQTITPPWLNFEVLTPAPIAMKPGVLIDYRIRVHGSPASFHGEFNDVNGYTERRDLRQRLVHGLRGY